MTNPRFRNKIINGNFDIWQRGTSQTNNGYGSDDRWVNANVGSTKTHSRQAFTLGQTEVPGNPTFFSRTVVSSVTGANNQVSKYQNIEYVKMFSNKTATLSFWAKTDSNKNMAVEFVQYFGSGGSPSPSVSTLGVTTISLTTSWKKYVVTVQLPSISGKLGTDGNDRLVVLFWFDAGSDFNSRTNSLGQQSGTFDIAQIQLEEGSVATPFEQRPLGLELSLCQRYCRSIYTAVRNISTHIVGEIPIVNIPISMRSAPTIRNEVKNFAGSVNACLVYATFYNLLQVEFYFSALDALGSATYSFLADADI